MAIQRDDPYGAFNIKVTITPQSGNKVLGAFSDVSGLSTEITYADYRDGTDPRNRPRKVPLAYKGGVALWHTRVELGQHWHLDRVVSDAETRPNRRFGFMGLDRTRTRR